MRRYVEATIVCAATAAAIWTAGMANAQRVEDPRSPGERPPNGPPGPASAEKPARPSNQRYGDPAHRDLSGVWLVIRSAQPARQPIPLTKPYIAKLDETRRLTDAGKVPSTSVTRCIALGMPRYMTLGMELIQTPGQVTMVSSILTDVRRIYIDGQGHTNEFEPSYNGDSIGHWEGDTLVVETNNLLAGTIDEYGIPNSDKLVVTERLHRTAPTTLEDDVTLTDPEALTRPFSLVRTFSLAPPGTRQEEYRCENNHNADNGDGAQGFVVDRK